jgi:hypothetical protein
MSRPVTGSERLLTWRSLVKSENSITTGTEDVPFLQQQMTPYSVE